MLTSLTRYHSFRTSYSGKIQGTFKEHSGNIQGKCKIQSHRPFLTLYKPIWLYVYEEYSRNIVFSQRYPRLVATCAVHDVICRSSEVVVRLHS
jgi:hypothetical protein